MIKQTSFQIYHFRCKHITFIGFFVQVIILSASANRLAKLKIHAATYASLIMEELDPDDLGYIEVPGFFIFNSSRYKMAF